MRLRDTQLTVEQVHEQRTGEVWFALDHEVSVDYYDGELWENIDPRTSKHWLISYAPTHAQTWVYTAPPQPSRTRSDYPDEFQVTTMAPLDPASALTVFTACIHEVH